MKANRGLPARLIQKQAAQEGREYLDWVLYDSLLTTVSITQTLRFFQNTIGGVGRNRTNMKGAGILPSPQSFLIKKIAVAVFNLDGTSFKTAGAGAGAAIEYPLNQLLNRAYFDLLVDPSTDYEGHVSQMYEQVDRVNDSTAALLTQAVISGAYKFKSIALKYPIIIRSQRSFGLDMTLTAPAAAGGYTAANSVIYWYLIGELRRNA